MATRFSNALGAYSPRLMSLAYPGQAGAASGGPSLQPLPVSPGMGRVGAPSVQQAAQQAAQQSGAGSVGVGSVGATDATPGAPSTPSPDQSISGVMGALNNGLSVVSSPMGALAALAVSTYRGVEPTLSLMDALTADPATMDPGAVTGAPGSTDSVGVGDAMAEGSPGDPATATPGGMSGGLAGGQEYGGGNGGIGDPGDDSGAGPGAGGGVGPDGSVGSGGDDVGGTGDQGGAGTGAGDAGSGADAGPGAGGDGPGGPGDYRVGGLIHPDGDARFEEVPINAHEGEFVLRPEAVSYYGPALLAAMNAQQVPRSRLMALLGD